MLDYRALLLLLSSLCLPWAAQGAGGQSAPKGKTGKPVVKTIKQKDGSVVKRLDLGLAPRTTLSDAPRDEQQLVDKWLDAVTEPRIMTALATVAMEPGKDTRDISLGVDPTRVRNWAEFVDPNLYLRWQAALLDTRFNPAIHNRPESQGLLPGMTAFPVTFPVPTHLQPGAPLPATLWARALDGVDGKHAVQEWLILPSQDPRANVWLRAGQNERY
ncbi:MAG: hypothetical protein AB1899_13020 [Pseudomonadota bacterium]